MTTESIVTALREFFRRRAVGFGLEEAFLYGSWAMGHGRADSDIDIAVVFKEEDLSDEEIFQRIDELTSGLSEILSCEVSVIPVYLDFRKPALYYNAVIKGIPVYVAEQSRHLRLLSVALYHMEDFEIFGTEWQLTIARSNLETLQNA
jgi:predicted nucleotidyltransferase